MRLRVAKDNLTSYCRSRFHTSTDGQAHSTAKTNKKNYYGLKLTASTVVASGLYYQFVLNSQEKRKINVNVQSLGRAAR